MLYIIKENARSREARGRNNHIDETAKRDAKMFPNVFGTYVENADQVAAAIRAITHGNRVDQVLHIYAHGNQEQIGSFGEDYKNDSFAATDSLARLLRDELQVFQQRGVNRIVLQSCYGASHISKVAPTIKYFVLPKGWDLTLQGGRGGVFTDPSGNMRVANNDNSAQVLDRAVGAKASPDRFNRLLEIHCQSIGEGLETVVITGEYEA
jgi:hypothetical protein